MTISSAPPARPEIVTLKQAAAATAHATTSQAAAVPWEQDAYIPTQPESPYTSYPAAATPSACVSGDAVLGKIVSILDLPIITISTVEPLVSKPATGVPIRKYESIYDIPNADILEDVIGYTRSVILHNIDMSEMTKSEIYNTIESVFKEYLGEDFLEPSIIHGGIGAGDIEYAHHLSPYSASSSFYSMLRDHGITVNHLSPKSLIEAKGYAGMSDSEMRTAVRSKYPETMTLRECILMGRELWQLGVEALDYGYGFVGYIQIKMYKHSKLNPESMITSQINAFDREFQKIYEAMLDKPADFETMKKSNDTFNGNRYQTFIKYSNIEAEVDHWLSFCGGNKLYNDEMMSSLHDALKGLNRSLVK